MFQAREYLKKMHPIINPIDLFNNLQLLLGE